jgi:hypothetical protein
VRELTAPEVDMTDVSSQSYSTVNVPAPSPNPDQNDTIQVTVNIWQQTLGTDQGDITQQLNLPVPETPFPAPGSMQSIIAGAPPEWVVVPWHIIGSYEMTVPTHGITATGHVADSAFPNSRVGVTALGDALAVAWVDGSQGTVGQLNFMIFDAPSIQGSMSNINEWIVQAGPVALAETSYNGCDIAQDSTGEYLQFAWTGTDPATTPNLATALTVGSLPQAGTELPNKTTFWGQSAYRTTAIASTWFADVEGQPASSIAAWTGVQGSSGNLNFSSVSSADQQIFNDEWSPNAPTGVFEWGQIGGPDPELLLGWSGTDRQINILALDLFLGSGTKFVIDTLSRCAPSLATTSPAPLLAGNVNFPWYMAWVDAATGNLAVAVAPETLDAWEMMTLFDRKPQGDVSMAYLPAVNLLAIGYVDQYSRPAVSIISPDSSTW